MVASPNDKAPRKFGGRDPFPEEHLRCPGLVGDIAAWMDSCAVHPAPLLSFGAALALVGTLIGRRYASPTGLRANVYLIGVARSGVGKDNARQCAMSLLARAGLDALRGTDEIASAPGLLRKMEDHPVRLFCTDEFGQLLAALGSRNAATHERAIITTLMKLHSAAQGVFLGTAYVEREATPIEQPHCVLWATTTPGQFYDALKGSHIVDGFLNRMMVFEVEHGQMPPRSPTGSSAQPPDELIQRVKALGSGAMVPGAGNLVGIDMASTRHAPYVVPMTPEAQDKLDEFSEGVRRQINSATNPETWARTREHAIRLALICAVGQAPNKPVIGLEQMRWGSRIAWWAAKRVQVAVDERVGGNEEERAQQQILRVIREAGGSMSQRDLTRSTRGLEKRIRTTALQVLVESERLVVRLTPTVGRAAAIYDMTPDDD